MEFALAVTGLTVAMQVAPVLILVRIALRRGAENLAQTHAREREMVAEAHRREFETRLGNALEMAANEWEVLSVAGRAVTSLVGDDRVEILLADNSNAHLERALVSGTDPDGPACGVTSPSQCVAARRGQTQVFNDSEALDACPHLQGREYGRCAGVCVPVSIMGRTTGVVHWAGAVDERPERVGHRPARGAGQPVGRPHRHDPGGLREPAPGHHRPPHRPAEPPGVRGQGARPHPHRRRPTAW